MVDLKPHQAKAVDQLGNGKILWGGVGSGKSRVAMAYFYKYVCGGTYGDMGSIRTPKDIYIITTAKKRDSLDWNTEAARFGISRNRESSARGIQLTVDSWNNIGNYENIENAFYVFDEQRLVGGGEWTKSFIKIARRNQWILLSATPGDTWLDYIAVFVANGFYKNRTEFKRRHVVYNSFSKYPKVDHYVEVGRLVRLRNQILVHMPYEMEAVRKFEYIQVDHDEELFRRVWKKRWHVYENRPLKDVAELFRVMRKVVNSDSSRLKATQDLLNTHPRLIVFYNFDYELEILRGLSRSISSPTATEQRRSTSLDTNESIETSTAFEENHGLGNDEDPLKGTIWEKGWDEEKAIRAAAMSEKNDVSSAKLSDVGKKESTSTSSERTSSTSTLTDTKKSSAESPMISTRSSQTDLESTLELAEWNGHKHEDIPDTDRWVYLVQYAAGSEGWNCTSTNAICFYSLTYSYKNYHQAQGRIDRLDTKYQELFYYVLKSNSMIDKAIWKSLSRKKNFNESSLKI